MESPQSSSAAVMTITSFCGPRSGSSLSSIASKPLTETSSATPERSQRRRLRTHTNIYLPAWYLYPDRNNDPQQWENHFAAPKNNIKYTAEESGFATRYPDHPDTSTQHFFFTTPKQHGIEPFWPHLLAGASSVHFHRPDSGLRINGKALACLKAARLLEQHVPLWNVEPANEFLSNQADDEAYLAATKKHDAFAV